LLNGQSRSEDIPARPNPGTGGSFVGTQPDFSTAKVEEPGDLHPGDGQISPLRSAVLCRFFFLLAHSPAGHKVPSSKQSDNYQYLHGSCLQNCHRPQIDVSSSLYPPIHYDPLTLNAGASSIPLRSAYALAHSSVHTPRPYSFLPLAYFRRILTELRPIR